MTTTIVKTTCFPDDIWSQIKGFLFEPDIKCDNRRCELKINKDNHNDFKLVKKCRNNIILFAPLSGNSYECGKSICLSIELYNEIKNIPLNMNIEDALIPTRNIKIENTWFCKNCWSAIVFDPFAIEGCIQDILDTNGTEVSLTKVKKEQHKLFGLFKGVFNKSIFDKQRLSATTQKYRSYVREMEKKLIIDYNRDIKKFNENTQVLTQDIKKNWGGQHRINRRKRLQEIIKEVWIKLALRDYNKRRINYKNFLRIINSIDRSDGFDYDYIELKYYAVGDN